VRRLRQRRARSDCRRSAGGRKRPTGPGWTALLAGVVAGLRAAGNDVCVFLPVDVPLATPELVRALGEACDEAAVPQTGPLPGAYARSALAVLERRLTAGELALRDALAELATVTVELDPAQLVNVNAPEELAVLRP
jgi:molybdopterin-guanine dinucleotide biosynthesis protein A